MVRKFFLNWCLFFIGSFVANAESNEWLKELPDNVPVRELSIPGAHDAATGEGFASGSAILAAFSGVTQTLTLSEQWDAGVRAFDLRPAYKSNAEGKLQIFHGILETKISLKTALATIIGKLDMCPDEFAIIMIRHETDSDNNNELWTEAMSELLSEFDDNIVAFSPGMTVGAARGKVILLTRDGFTSVKAGTIAGWSHSDLFDDQTKATVSLGRLKSKLYVQDFYECGTVEKKYETVKNMMEYSTRNTNSNLWIINHLSGYIGSSGSNSNILNLAGNVNRMFSEYLDSSHPGRTGIVMLDFAGTDKKGSEEIQGNEILKKIISQNHKYIKSEVTGLYQISYDNVEPDYMIYDLYGRFLGKGKDLLYSLPSGIYITDGQKIVIR